MPVIPFRNTKTMQCQIAIQKAPESVQVKLSQLLFPFLDTSELSNLSIEIIDDLPIQLKLSGNFGLTAENLFLASNNKCFINPRDSANEKVQFSDFSAFLKEFEEKQANSERVISEQESAISALLKRVEALEKTLTAKEGDCGCLR